MKAYTNVSRKNVGEDRVAMCPNFGCEHLTRVKPLKFRFLGFGKHPKCKKHRIPLVYVNERIGDFVDAALACLFDKAGLPPRELLEDVKSKSPEEFNSFVEGWVYCITVGRGAPIVSRYMDTISNAYLKQLTKKQIKAFKKGDDSKPNLVNKAIKDGMDEITIQYTRILKHLRAHSEILIDHQDLKSISKSLQNYLKDWQKYLLKHNEIINSPENEHEMTLKEIKSNYDQILNIGTCRCLLGLNPDSKEIKKAKITSFDRFSAYHEFFSEGLTGKFTKSAICDLVKTKIPSKEDKEEQKLNIKEEQTFMTQSHVSNINILNFQKEVVKHIKNVIKLIESTEEQKKIILSNSEKILKKHISRTEMGEIVILSHVNPLKNAVAIIYAVLVSNKNMPNISQTKLSKIAGINQSAIAQLYNKYYKIFAQKLDFDFQSAQLGRNVISLYFFELLLDKEIDPSEIVLHLRNTIIYTDSLRKHCLLKQLTENEIKYLQDMVINYPETFMNYFSDLVNIIKLLVISNNFHKIISADFSVKNFALYLIDKKINLFLGQYQFVDVIGEIFNYLGEKYPKFFSNRANTIDNEKREDAERTTVIGSRIKLYIMKHIYHGRYFDFERGIASCPECLDEKLEINTSLPRIRSKDFHHKGTRIEGFESRRLYRLFTKNRGNPYFLSMLIKKMEKRSVSLRCRSHHNIIKAIHFNNFKKFICWENIPSEFPQDIFELPAEIIHLLAMICVDNYSKTKTKTLDERLPIRRGLIHKLKKRYIIELVNGGICPACGEFNTRDHLPSFHFNHFFESSEITPEEKRRREEYKISELYRTFSCSELVGEMERQKGGYVCGNCHFVIHTKIELINKIYDDKNIIKAVINDRNRTIKKFEQNLICHSKLIKDPLKLDMRQESLSLMNFLFALYEISEEKCAITSLDLQEKLKISRTSTLKFFAKRKELLEKLGNIIPARGCIPTKYHMNIDGKRIVRLMHYFKEYYQNCTS